MTLKSLLTRLFFPSPRLRGEGAAQRRVRGISTFRKPLTPALMILMALTTPAIAADLRANVTDSDGRITLGDLFDQAGTASDIIVGVRQAQTAVLDAGAVQTIAARNGVRWDNPRGLRRIIVVAGPDSAQTQPAVASQAAIPAVAMALRSYAIRRGEAVSVTWRSGSLSLTVTGTAQKDGAIGDVVQIQNPASKQLIDAVVIGSGQAVSGPAALQTRQILLSSR